MKNIIMIVFTLLFIVQSNVYASKIENVYIIIDLSDSSPHVKLRPFAKKSALYVDRHIKDLSLGSTIQIRTFGDYSRDKNLFSIKFTFLKRKGSRPQEIRAIVKKIIVNLPDLVKNGKLILQDKTSLIGELKIVGQQLDRSQHNTLIILSDLLEYSADGNAYQLIKRKYGALPPPKANYLSGVDVITLGAGYGVKNSLHNDRLEAIWTKYFEQAGVKKFRYLSDF